MARILSAAEIWAAKDIREEEVEVPEWGGSVRVRGLDLVQIAAVADAATKTNRRTGRDETDRKLLMLYTLIEGLVEPKLSYDDAAQLEKKSATAVTRIVQAINALGPTEEAVNGATKSAAPQQHDPFSVLVGSGASHDEGGAMPADDNE